MWVVKEDLNFLCLVKDKIYVWLCSLFQLSLDGVSGKCLKAPTHLLHIHVSYHRVQIWYKDTQRARSAICPSFAVTSKEWYVTCKVRIRTNDTGRKIKQCCTASYHWVIRNDDTIRGYATSVYTPLQVSKFFRVFRLFVFQAVFRVLIVAATWWCFKKSFKFSLNSSKFFHVLHLFVFQAIFKILIVAATSWCFKKVSFFKILWSCFMYSTCSCFKQISWFFSLLPLDGVSKKKLQNYF